MPVLRRGTGGHVIVLKASGQRTVAALKATSGIWHA